MIIMPLALAVKDTIDQSTRVLHWHTLALASALRGVPLPVGLLVVVL
jgi:hypothetical protein